MGGDAGVPGPHHRGHHLSWQELRGFLGVITPPLRRFLIMWLIAYPAMNGLATLFPVAMTRQFDMGPVLPSIAYALGVAASLLLYAPVGCGDASSRRRPHAGARDGGTPGLTGAGRDRRLPACGLDRLAGS